MRLRAYLSQQSEKKQNLTEQNERMPDMICPVNGSTPIRVSQSSPCAFSGAFFILTRELQFLPFSAAVLQKNTLLQKMGACS